MRKTFFFFFSLLFILFFLLYFFFSFFFLPIFFSTFSRFLEFLVQYFFHIFQCDLAARNVLVTHDLNVKIADFGHSERDYFEVEAGRSQEGGPNNPKEHLVCQNNKQPICWVAYEVLQSKIKLYESDLWSFGVFMWEVFELGKGKPYEFLRDDKCKIHPSELLEYLDKGSRLSQPENCPEDVYDLMLLCWKQEPSERPSFKHLKMELESFALILDQSRVRRDSVASRFSYNDRTHLNTQTSYVSMIPPPPPQHLNLTYAALNANDENENFAIL